MPSGQPTLQTTVATSRPSSAPWWASLGLGALALLHLHALAPVLADPGVAMTPAAAEAMRLLVGATAYILLGVGAVGLLQRLLGNWQHSLLGHLPSSGWHHLEHLAGAIFSHQGLQVVETAQLATGGIHLLLARDGRPELTLAHCLEAPTGGLAPRDVRRLQLAMAAEDADHGVLVTTGVVGLRARWLASRAGIQLMDGRELRRRTLAVRRPVPLGQTAQLLRLDAHRPSPACPHCGSDMALRASGPRHAPTWHCSTGPACSGTRPLVAGLG